jgi:succinoglycan biosynthesis protein ExoM
MNHINGFEGGSSATGIPLEQDAGASGSTAVPTIAVAICTYERNGPLATLLHALLVNQERLKGKARLAVVVVDDSADGKAHEVVDQFQERFTLGLHYKFSGKQNISIARNLAIETASLIADWTAMVDDDCEPVPNWLEALLEVQRVTGADAVTGPMMRRVPADAPRWLVEEPFLDLGLEYYPDCVQLPFAATFNSMIASRWIRDNPAVRFEPSLGVIGGEDMVFYRMAHAIGLRINYSQRAAVYENEPPARATLNYQLRWYFWHGNSSYITSVRTGMSPLRMFLHGLNSLKSALLRPLNRALRGQKPQLRFCLALVLHAVGKLVGPLEIRVRHPS